MTKKFAWRLVVQKGRHKISSELITNRFILMWKLFWLNLAADESVEVYSTRRLARKMETPNAGS